MKALRLVLGILVANVLGACLVTIIVQLFAPGPGSAAVQTLPHLVTVPVAMGFAAVWVWRPLNLGIGSVLLHSFTATVLGLILAAAVFKEGAICLIILSPLLLGGFIAGAIVGRLLFRPGRDRLNAFLVPACLIALMAEPAFRSPVESVVTDELRIAAPPAKVWPHLLAFNEIPDPPGFWMFRLGLPYPVATTNSGNFAGADRACIFSAGAIFKEKVVEIEPERVLTFDIIEMPPDPELIGHLDATRGQFELRDNGDGTTTLIGRTWYTLHVRPAPYFNWWTHTIFRAVHLRVMENARRLAELP